jgi:hypothetical protein
MRILIPLSIIICTFVLLPSVFAQHSKAEIMSIFEKEIAINEDFKSSLDNPTHKGISGKSYDKLRKDLENYHENIFTPSLETAKQIICNNKDRELMRHFLKVIISTTNSANEGPSWILGELFICQSDLVISEYNKLNSSEKSIILKDLQFGFDNVTYNKEKDIPNFRTLKSKLLNINK